MAHFIIIYEDHQISEVQAPNSPLDKWTLIKCYIKAVSLNIIHIVAL